MAVWAEAGWAAYNVKIRRVKTKKRLSIFEFDLIADLVIAISVWMDFKRIPRGFGREVGRPPGFGDHFIHHDHFGVNPKHSQVERHK